jgi:transcriptional regulator with XRE-family HTH domain
MVDLKLVIASNIIRLRTDAGMTQSELGAKLNYSDKSISKWERAESLPDANVLKQMSEIFGVSMDYLFSTNDEWKPDPEPSEKEESCSFNSRAVEAVALCGIATLAFLLFILFWIINDVFIWIVFFAALPVMVLTHLVLNSVWHKGKGNILLVGLFVFSLLLLVYVSIFASGKNAWQIFLLMIPTALILFFVSRIRKKRK